MAWIRMVSYEEATGSLRRQYDQAIQRAGRVFNILRIQSLNPETLLSSIRIYIAVMLGVSGLSRAEKEMIAVVVSATNHCHY